MLSRINSVAFVGIEGISVRVEVETNLPGDPKFLIVGLPDNAVKESHERVQAALMNNRFAMPKTRTLVNLSPGDLRKEGPIYDLPIALGVITSTRQALLPLLKDFIIVGELSLSGELLPVPGSVALAMQARKFHKKLILPHVSAEIAAFVSDVEIYSAKRLAQIVSFLSGTLELPKISRTRPLIRMNFQKGKEAKVDKKFIQKGNEFGDKEGQNFTSEPSLEYDVDFSEIKGQPELRRAVEVAVAGGHNLLMVGTPGSGKSMIAKRIPTIMPEPTLEEFLEILSIYSVDHVVQSVHEIKRPFRTPHHTISDVGLLGGGRDPKPGEISLAHNGVLFLDELPEFHRSTLEVLRQPLENGAIIISRSAGKVKFPCSFMLIAAMNPCPCGFLGDPKRTCLCSPTQIQRYRSRISGPLLDRIDIHVDVRPVEASTLREKSEGERSAEIRERIVSARKIQAQRNPKQATVNAKLRVKDLQQICALDTAGDRLLMTAIEQLGLSARAHDRILKVARTIADLEASESIREHHLLEAIHYRTMDRKLF